MNIFSSLATLYSHRELIWELVKRDVMDRYVGQILGALWSIGHPVFLMMLYVFVFAVVFPAKLGDEYAYPGGYVSFILSGLIPWLASQEIMSRSVSVILQNSSWVKQIVFPLEVLPVKTVLGALPGVGVSLAILVLVELFMDGTLKVTWLLLPFLLVFFVMFQAGVAYMLSAVGVFFRDLKDIVQVFVTANLFLQPIFYLPERIPEYFSWFFYINPFSYQVWVFQDVLYYGRVEHPLAWVIYPLGSILVFGFGSYLFDAFKSRFGDVL